jgi:hypothetical protein
VWPVVARNKKSVTRNLHLPEGQNLVRSLVADADVLLENFPPRDTRALGHVAGGALGNQPAELLHQVLLNLLPCGVCQHALRACASLGEVVISGWNGRG